MPSPTQKSYDWGGFFDVDPLSPQPPISPSAFGLLLLQSADAPTALGLIGGEPSLGFTPENVANKSTNTSLGTSDTLYPSQKAVKTYVDSQVSGGGVVTSVFGRTGAVVAASGDYSFAQIGSKPTTLLGYGITDAQPLDSDLTAIAALSTTSFGRGFLPLADAAAARSYIGAGTSSFSGAFADLTGKPTTIAGYGITDFNSLGDARWQPLGSYLTSVTANSPLTGAGTSGSHLSIPAASASTDGYLDKDDFAAFDTKGLPYLVSNTARVDANGNDGTGTVGDMGKPFLTNQAAINALDAYKGGSNQNTVVLFLTGRTGGNIVTGIRHLRIIGLSTATSAVGDIDFSPSGIDPDFQLTNVSTGDITCASDIDITLFLNNAVAGNVTNTGTGEIFITRYVSAGGSILNVTANGGTVSVSGISYSFTTIDAGGGDIQISDCVPVYPATGFPQTSPPISINSPGSEVTATRSILQDVTCDTIHRIDSVILGTLTGTDDPQYFYRLPYDITLAAGQSVRRNAGDTGFEAFTAGTGDMLKADNLSGLANYSTARSNLGLGTLATQNGTFSGTSSGTNTGDQTGDGILGLSSNGLIKRTGANTFGVTTDNSSNWDTAYTDRLKWDGGATGLVAATGRTSLGLGTAATQNTGTSGATLPLLDGNNTWSGTQIFTAGPTIAVNNGTNAGGADLLVLSHNTTGTPANGLGVRLLFQAEDSTTTDQVQGQLITAWSDVTNATRSAYFDFQLTNSAVTASKMRLFPSGGLSVNNTTDPGAGIINANTGFQIGNAAASGNYLRGNGTNFVSSAIQAGDVPILNQNTTGSAASLSISGQTGLLSVTGLTSTNRIKTVRDAADTLLELGGSYTPTGTWTSMPLTTPKITTGLNDANGNSEIALTATGSAIFGLTLANAASGGTVALGVTTPTQAAAGIVGTPLSLAASNAVAGSSTAGAVAGGSLTLTSGDAARLTSGNAKGGDINLSTGAGIGTGTAGQIISTRDGSNAAPAYSFASATNAGMCVGIGGAGRISIVSGGNTIGYFDASNTTIRFPSAYKVMWSSSGADAAGTGGDTGFKRNAAGVVEVNNAVAGQWGSLLAGTRDSGTTTVTNGLTLGHQSTGTPAAGLGTGILFNINSSTTADQNAAQVYTKWSDATHATRTSSFGIQLVNSAAALADVFTITGAGAASFPGTLSVTGHTTFEGVTSTGATGTGKLVYDTSPVLVTPNLGTPSAGVGTNLTALNASNISSGTLAEARLPTTHRAVAVSGTASSTTNSTSETNLAVVTIPAGTLNANGVIRISSLWKFVGTANTKTPTIRFSSTSGDTSGGATYQNAAGVATNLSARILTEIYNANSTSSQVGFVGSATGLGASNSTVTTSSINTANASYVNFNASVANTGDTAQLVGYTVEVINP